jgi:uncharacterized damage-inducible protein DinB
MQTLLSMFRTTNYVLNLSVADLSEEVARQRSRGSEGPSVLWTLGHLMDARHNVLKLLGREAANRWTADYGSVAATDGSNYPSLAEMVKEWNVLHEALEAAFAASSPGDLERTLPAAGAHGEERVRDKLSFLAWHEGYHTGVIGAIRRSAAMPGPADLVAAASAP